ncbi:MAG: hypothetical protein IT233_09220 [Bacteroidia bacterium]|nr:hypothetical protein [Bacteroidia bacterium]
MKKLTLILMLIGAVAFGTSGCGNNNTESETKHKEGDGHNHEKDDTTHKEGDGHKH